MKSQKIQADVAALGTVIDALDPLEETKRLWVLQTAAARFSLAIDLTASGGGIPPRGSETPANINSGKAGGDAVSPQSFIRAKNPTTDVQRIACLAYYLTKHRNTDRFKTKQLTELNTEAKAPKFSNATVAANNARREKYLTPAGKGEKQLTNDGEDLVDALPDQEAVKALHRPRKKRARKKK
jgi:hypothetical protein